MITTEDIHIRSLELARIDPPLEQDVQLSVRASLGLRETEEDPDHHQEAHAGPEESALGAPAPTGRRGGQLVGREDVDHDPADVVQVASENNGLGAQTGRGDLGDERVADGTDGEIVDECEEQQHGSDSPSGSLVGSGSEGCEADDEEQAAERDRAVEVEGSSPGAVHHEP